MPAKGGVEELIERIRRFARERDWEKFHSPKNLAMALSVEVAEIVELFQWLTPEESADLPEDKRASLRQEIGDVLIYLLNLADHLGIDALEAAREKLEINARKYPVGLVKGQGKKSTEY